ncbi:MAG TPA: hypothetical protein RMH99_23450 [Sandaracinaceae bacterium LLY-WYZ-13_1]|nr:hypothetical protein [Sandaracinaceae bacterium LLY-WYZ-13_1]
MASDFRYGFSCDQRWTDLPPRGAGRYCAQCDTTVLDVSRLTRREVQARLRTEGRICGRVRFDDRGEPIYRREPRGMGLGALAVVGALAGGCGAREAVDEPAAVRLVQGSPPDHASAEVPEPLPEGVAVDDLNEPRARAIETALASLQGPPPPTEEQRRLTEAKHRRRRYGHRPASVSPPRTVSHPRPAPPEPMFLGEMILESD